MMTPPTRRRDPDDAPLARNRRVAVTLSMRQGRVTGAWATRPRRMSVENPTKCVRKNACDAVNFGPVTLP